MKKWTAIALGVAALTAGCDNRPLLGRLTDGGAPMDGDVRMDGDVAMDGDVLGDGSMGDGSLGDGSMGDGSMGCVAPRVMCGDECVDVRGRHGLLRRLVRDLRR